MPACIRSMCAVGLVACIAAVMSAGATRVEPELTLEPIKVAARGVEYSAERGTLRVPEGRKRPDAATIKLAFVRLRSTSDAPGAPVFFLAGGPGDAATPMARSPGWAPLLELGDVVLLDQRGTGSSRPLLAWAPEEFSPAPLFADGDGATRLLVEAATKAAEHFRAQGVTIASYNTVENAADVDALRRALGYQKISLMGHSYGTHLGLEIVRRFGAHVDRFVSVGTAGMNDIHKLPDELDAHVRMLSAIIAADPTVGKDVPDFGATLRRVLERAGREPFRVVIPDGNASVEVEVGARGVRMIVLRDLGDVSDLVVLPRLLYTLDQGDTSVLAWFVAKRYVQFDTVPVMMLAMRAASGATAERWAEIERQAPASLFGMERVIPSREVAAALGAGDLGDEFRAPVKSEVPTLFISGTLDANTPPDQAERVRAGFTNAGHLIVENGGHEDLLGRAEVRAAIIEFLKSGTPRDARIQAPALQFIPVTGPTRGHPAVKAGAR